MDRSEPALVPGWLKSGGSAPSGGNTSLLHLDDHSVPKHARIKTSLNSCDRDTPHLPVLETTTSAYVRQGSSSNGTGHLRSTSSFGRNQPDRKDVSDYHDKEKLVLGDHRQHEHSDLLGNKFDKDKLRRSQSMITGKQDESWSKKVVGDWINPNKNKHSNSNGNSMPGRIGVGAVHDTAFEQDFPSLGSEESLGGISRVSSPSVSPSIRTGSSAVVSSDSWKSVLADVPVVMGSSSMGIISAQQAVPATSATMGPNITTGLNMAEALVQGPPRAHTPPQLAAGIQRFEELAIRQSKLIPMTPSTPKTQVVSPSERMKPKIGHQQHSFHLLNHTRGPARSDSTKISNEGRLQVLKLSRELSGICSAAKDSSSFTNGSSKVVNSLLGITPLAVGPAPSRSIGNNSNQAGSERNPSVLLRPTIEKRPTSQVQSRNDFFNHLKKKSSTNSTSEVSDPSLIPSSIPEKSGELVTEVTSASVPDLGVDSSSSDISVTGLSSKDSGEIVHNGYAYCGPHQFGNEKKDSKSNETPNPDEEEAAFLHSLGWDENAGEDEGLTEEEIRAFFEEYKKLRPSSKLLQGLRLTMTLDAHNSSCDVASSVLSSSDSESDA